MGSYFKNLKRSSSLFVKSLFNGLPNAGGVDFFTFTSGGKQVTLNLNDVADVREAYERCPPVASLLHKMAKALINSNVWVLDKAGKDATSKEAMKLKRLLKTPNPIQSWKQFEAQYDIMVTLYGYCPILAVVPEGYTENIDASALWVIPPYSFNIEKTGKQFFQSTIEGIISEYRLAAGSDAKTLTKKNVLILRDIGISFSSNILPQSRFLPQQETIANIIGAIEANGKLINERGALGILSNRGAMGQEAMPLKPSERKELQEEFKNYGIQRDQANVIITSAALQWQSMSVPVRDLMLHETIQAGTEMLCDCIGYPIDLVAGSTKKTFNNVREAKQSLYQDELIPKATAYYEQWNEFFQTDKHGIKLDVDYSHIEALQQSAKEKADARLAFDNAAKIEWESSLITLNRWRELIGEDTVQGGDIYIWQVQKNQAALATVLGVGGVQALQSIIADPNISPDAKKSTLVILFGLTPEQAGSMVIATPAPPPSPPPNPA